MPVRRRDQRPSRHAVVPAQDADPRALALMIAVAVGLCIVATILFARRDVQSA
jgi:hypothetical protein